MAADDASSTECPGALTMGAVVSMVPLSLTLPSLPAGSLTAASAV